MCTQFNSLEMLKYQCVSHELLKRVIVSNNTQSTVKKQKKAKQLSFYNNPI